MGEREDGRGVFSPFAFYEERSLIGKAH